MLKGLILAGAAAAAVLAAPAFAADFSFVGALDAPSDVLFFDFTVGTGSTVTLRSYSYAGGTNAQGVVIARGGFDPILGVYESLTGTRIGQNDDGGSNVPADINGARFDTYFQALLAPGAYRAAVSVFPNFGPANLNTGTFSGASTFNSRTNAFAFDVLGVDQATGPGGGAVPEPATWAMMLVGFGMAGFGLRSRRASKVTTRVAFA